MSACVKSRRLTRKTHGVKQSLQHNNSKHKLTEGLNIQKIMSEREMGEDTNMAKTNHRG